MPHSTRPITRKSDRRGFTLLEVLSAMVAASLALGLVFTALQSGRNHTLATRRYAEGHGAARALTGTVRNDLDRISASRTLGGGGVPTPAGGNAGGVLTLPDGTTITYELVDTTVYRTDPSGARRPVADSIAAIDFDGTPATRSVTVTITPAASPYAFAVTRYVRHQ